MKPAEHFFVNGIVAMRDKMPYVQLATEHGLVIQLTMAQARQVAADILQMSARAEADALLVRFCEAKDLQKLGAVLMDDFRDFRAELDKGDTGRVP